MHFKFSKPLITVCAAIAISVLEVGLANASTLIFSHNGTPDSMPHPGTDAVNVQLNCTPTASFTEECNKLFFENATHRVDWNETQGVLIEDVVNNTGVPWSDYHFEITGLGGAFSITTDTRAERNGVDIISDFQVDFSSGTSVWVFFSVPFTPTLGGPDTLHIELSWMSTEGLAVITQHPSIPEPGTLALFGLGLAGLGFARRRKAA